jgi:hypothetical protein
MKKIKFFVWVLWALVFFEACKKPDFDTTISDNPERVVERSELRVEQGRLVFNDFEHFLQVAEQLDGLSEEELDQWEHSKGIASLRSALKQYYADSSELIDEKLEGLASFNFPKTFQSLINTDGECRLGDDLIWYHDGLKHYVPNADEALLAQIKTNPALSAITAKAGATTEDVASETNRVTLGANSLDARHQWEFWQYSYYGYPNRGRRKYVHEIVTYSEQNTLYEICKKKGCYKCEVELCPVSYYFYSTAFVRIKMEWRGKRWRPAGENREILYNLALEGILRVWDGGALVYTNTNSYFASRPLFIGRDTYVTIASFSGSGPTWISDGLFIRWELDVSGNIQQRVVGDSNSPWNNQGFPLW